MNEIDKVVKTLSRSYDYQADIPSRPINFVEGLADVACFVLLWLLICLIVRN